MLIETKRNLIVATAVSIGLGVGASVTHILSPAEVRVFEKHVPVFVPAPRPLSRGACYAFLNAVNYPIAVPETGDVDLTLPTYSKNPKRALVEIRARAQIEAARIRARSDWLNSKKSNARR